MNDDLNHEKTEENLSGSYHGPTWNTNSETTRYYNGINKFARAAVLCMIFSIISVMTVYMSMFFASLGILFAMLSRQDSTKMPKSARTSFIVCTIILVGMVILVILVMRWLFMTFPPEVLTDPQALYDALMEYMISMGIDPQTVVSGGAL